MFPLIVITCTLPYCTIITRDTRTAAIPFDPAFQGRGVLFDKKTGNLLKLDHFKSVSRACHGRSPLSAEQIALLYPEPLHEFKV